MSTAVGSQPPLDHDTHALQRVPPRVFQRTADLARLLQRQDADIRILVDVRVPVIDKPGRIHHDEHVVTFLRRQLYAKGPFLVCLRRANKIIRLRCVPVSVMFNLNGHAGGRFPRFVVDDPPFDRERTARAGKGQPRADQDNDLLLQHAPPLLHPAQRLHGHRGLISGLGNPHCPCASGQLSVISDPSRAVSTTQVFPETQRSPCTAKSHRSPITDH